MYMWTASPICFWLERQVALRAFSRAWAKTGNRIAARMAMIAMTTRSSMRVKARQRLMVGVLLRARVRKALQLEARLGNRHCIRAILQVDVNRLARVVPGVAIRGQEVAASLMEERLGELVTVVPGVGGGAIPRRIRPLPGLIPLDAIAGFPD